MIVLQAIFSSLEEIYLFDTKYKERDSRQSESDSLTQ